MAEPLHSEVETYQSKYAARRQYLLSYERLCEIEQIARLEGRDDEAEDAHRAAVIALKAWDAELIP